MEYINRWLDFENITVNFRYNYKNMTEEKLHSKNDNIFRDLLNMSDKFIDRGYCDVCDTSKFEYKGLKYMYHKGLEKTSINMYDKVLQINDIILFPDGELYYDWDRSNKYIDEVRRYLHIKNEKFEFKKYPKIDSKPSTTFLEYSKSFSCGSGYGTCGGYRGYSLSNGVTPNCG